MNSMELSNYLEKIRFGRNMSQEEFVSDVVSIRQYQRYKNGDSVIPYEKIDQFAEKLGITTKKLLTEFEKEKSIQYAKINNFYNAVANNDYKSAINLKKDLDKDLIISEEGRLYFTHAKIVYDYYSRKLTMNEVINKVSELINYPEILKQQYFTDVEVLILSFLLSVFSGIQQEALLSKLNSLFNSEDNIMAGDSDYIYTLILMRIAKTYGIKRDFPNVIYYCDMGLERGIQYKQYYLWEYFFYYKALSHFALGQREEFDNSILRCYNVLNMEGNHSKFEKFTALIEKDFSINFREYVVNLIKPKSE
ncbi:MAG: helix-turn-helix transcriptional regulator [Bacilli bacterium]|nr:helix-turn-helix transcriptional regulator [Bacilli bacterium]MBN2877448.1 helix-turn-helix transcriptional regulator [Bacilli bacterium]